MAGVTLDVEKLRSFFPLTSVDDVLKVFVYELEATHREPNLALLSLVLGAAEHHIVSSRCSETSSDVRKTDRSYESASTAPKEKESASETTKISLITWEEVHDLYSSFEKRIERTLRSKVQRQLSKDLIRQISDVIWGPIARSYYTDRPHTQTLYDYLKGNRLDCFGVAYGVLAACQLLGFKEKEVHLALSEDHAWVVYQVDSDFVSAEVTWHGRGNDSKRGEPITRELYSKSWLYVDGKPVVCDSRWMEVAALVTCISPTIPLGLAGTDSPELRTLQQSLLWLVYDQGFLSRYPMALGNLAYLEEVSPSEGRPSALALHEKAIEVAIRCYDNMYVYPYTRKGAYLCRSSRIKEALESWSQAAEVIRCYNYSRQDEEVYKEFLELANELIPTLMKDAASGINARSIINDPECFAALLRFYDGICQWEEDSHTPVIHTGWARSLVHTFSRFDSTVRSLVRIVEDSDEWSEAGGSTSGASSSAMSENPGVPRKRKRSERTMTLRGSDRALRGRRPASDPVGGVAKEEAGVAGTGSAPLTEGPVGSPCENNNSLLVQDNNSQDEEEDLPEIVKDYLKAHQGTEAPSPLLEEIALGCRDHVLNPFYLLGYEGETPFLDTKDLDLLDSLFPTASPPGPADPLQCLPSVSSISDSLSPCSVATPSPNGPAWSPTAPPKEETPNGPAWSPTATVPKEEHPTQDEFQLDRVFSQRPTIELHSRKMHGLKDLLFCRRLNAQAIQLQLTAQSQVHVNRRHQSDAVYYSSSTTTSTRGGRSSKRRRLATNLNYP